MKSSLEWATIKLLQTQEFFCFLFFQQCTSKHCRSEWEKKNFFLPDTLIRADASIASVLCLYCSLSSGLYCSLVSFCRYTPLKQWTANRLPADWRLSIEDVFRQSVILHFSDTLKHVHSGRCMLVESSIVWDLRSSKALGGYLYSFLGPSCHGPTLQVKVFAWLPFALGRHILQIKLPASKF